MPKGQPRVPAGGLTATGDLRVRAEGAGRPTGPHGPLVSISARLPEGQREWLVNQPDGLTATLRRLIDQAMGET